MNNNGMDKDDKEEKGGLTLEQFTDIVLAQVSKRRQTKSCTIQLRGFGVRRRQIQHNILSVCNALWKSCSLKMEMENSQISLVLVFSSSCFALIPFKKI